MANIDIMSRVLRISNRSIVWGKGSKKFRINKLLCKKITVFAYLYVKNVHFVGQKAIFEHLASLILQNGLILISRAVMA